MLPRPGTYMYNVCVLAFCNGPACSSLHLALGCRVLAPVTRHLQCVRSAMEISNEEPLMCMSYSAAVQCKTNVRW